MTDSTKTTVSDQEALLTHYAAMKEALEQISKGPSLEDLGLPILSSGASDWQWAEQWRRISEKQAEVASDALSA